MNVHLRLNHESILLLTLCPLLIAWGPFHLGFLFHEFLSLYSHSIYSFNTGCQQLLLQCFSSQHHSLSLSLICVLVCLFICFSFYSVEYGIGVNNFDIVCTG